jgi:hypothetical protein
MKRLLSTLVLTIFSIGLMPTLAFALDVIDDANTNVDYVFTIGDNTRNESREAESNDGDDFEIFPDKDEDNQYAYIGMKAKFDRVFLDIPSDSDEYEEGTEWEYRDGNSWEDLDANTSEDDDIFTIKFDIPRDWESSLVEGISAYWLRVKPKYNVDDSPEVDQISTRTYNLRLIIEDEDNDEITNLTKSDFEISNGTDNKLYALRYLGNGEYELALQAEASDTKYTITIDDSRYKKASFSVGSLSSSRLSYSVELEDNNNRRNDDDDDDDDDDRRDRDNDVYLSGDCDVDFRDTYLHWAEFAINSLYCRDVVDGDSRYYFNPNDDVTRAEFLKMVLLNADIDIDDFDDEDEPFRDVSSSSWYYEYVVAAYELDIISYDYNFYPNSRINRAEAVTMIIRAADINTTGSTTPFSDVKTYSWYSPYVRTAYDYGIVRGYTDNTYRPANILSRAEASEMVNNTYNSFYR